MLHILSAAGNVVPAPKDAQLWLREVGSGAFPGGVGWGDNLFVLSPVFLGVGGGCGMGEMRILRGQGHLGCGKSCTPEDWRLEFGPKGNVKVYL